MGETESGATALSLVGGRLCLDFANTVGSHAGQHPNEHLRSYHDLVAWSRHAEILTDAEERRLLEAAEGRPGEAGVVLERAVVLREAIYRLLSAVEDMTPDERDELSEHLDRHIALPCNTACLGPDDVKAIADAGHEIGFHTRRHEPLPTLPDNLLARAMTYGKNELEEIAGQTIAAMAYPQGKADGRTARAAESAGYRFGYMGWGRPVRKDTDPLLMGRIEPSFKSTGHLSFRLAKMLLAAPRRDNGDAAQQRCGRASDSTYSRLRRSAAVLSASKSGGDGPGG